MCEGLKRIEKQANILRSMVYIPQAKVNRSSSSWVQSKVSYLGIDLIMEIKQIDSVSAIQNP